MLPTGHCIGGIVPWPNVAEGITLAQTIAFQLFKSLSNSSKILNRLKEIPHMSWYVMGPVGTNLKGNYWTSGDNFPKSTPISYYLQSNGKLDVKPPTNAQGQSTFIYNPNTPVPTVGGNNLFLPLCGPQLQNSVEDRGDVIVFTTEPLTQDLFLTGQMTATLYVSSNCTDTDFTVKVTDVYPNGASVLLQDGIVRMRWRNGPTQVSLMHPGTIYQVSVDIWSTSFIFNAGHSIRVDISSSNFPRFSANPNNGLTLDKNGPILIAANTIYHNSQYPSQLILPVVSQADLPPVNIQNYIEKLSQDIPNPSFLGKIYDNQL